MGIYLLDGDAADSSGTPTCCIPKRNSYLRVHLLRLHGVFDYSCFRARLTAAVMASLDSYLGRCARQNCAEAVSTKAETYTQNHGRKWGRNRRQMSAKAG